jgi:repressor LexA
MKLNEEMKIKRKEAKLTLEDVASKLNLSKTTVMRYESGAIRNIPNDNKIKICNLLDIDVNKYLDDEIKLHRFKKPILGIVKAGYDLLADENLLGYEDVSEKESIQGDYFLKVTGNSMTGSHIFDGDLVYVKRQNDVLSGEIAVIMIGSEVTIKKIIKKDDLLILEATNKEYETRYYNKKELEELPVRIIGRVLFNKITF